MNATEKQSVTNLRAVIQNPNKFSADTAKELHTSLSVFLATSLGMLKVILLHYDDDKQVAKLLEEKLIEIEKKRQQ